MCPARTPATIEIMKSTIMPATKIFLIELFILRYISKCLFGILSDYKKYNVNSEEKGCGKYA